MNMIEQGAVKPPKWLRDLQRLLGVKRQFVLEQNIRDLVVLPGQQGADPVRLPFTHALRTELHRLGYPIVLLWNPVTGLAVFPNDEETIAKARTIKGLDNLDSRGELRETSRLRLSELIARLTRDPQVPVSAALILDYASRITTNPARLTEEEQNFFLSCEKAANDAQPRSHESGPPRFSPVIWMVNRAQDLPSWFLLDNGGIHTITVTTPDLDTRTTLAAQVVSSIDSTASDEVKETAIRTLATQTEGMRLSALLEIGQLARSANIALPDVAEAVRSYQLGDLVQDSPWRSQRLKQAIKAADSDKVFSRRVLGQKPAVVKVLDMLKRSVFGLTGAHTRSAQGRPKGIMFFAGPTGVGKTEMAKTIADVIFGDSKRDLLRFDMSEFSSEHADARLIGAPPGYVGYEVGGELTNALREKPYRVILFDEIEKAHPRILDKFLQVLEDGRLTDGKGETVYFSESIIIFTSNLGIYVKQPVGNEMVRVENVKPGQPYPEVEQRIRKAIGDHFRYELNRPEILNRIGEDNIVVFGFIGNETARLIFDGNLKKVLDTVLEEHGITLTLDDKARQAIEDHCVSDLSNGARGIGTRLEASFTNALTRALFDQDAEAGSTWQIANFTLDGSSAVVELQHQR